ncbi:MAG: class I SAM-dependent methyltransferase [Treponema sp.]|nr:class I SAM-dependent methyltransferase [Treponema sp.]
MMSQYTHENYRKDKIRAIDAKFEAQKIAFAPLAFQAVRALLELGILQSVSDSSAESATAVGSTGEATGKQGITIAEAAQKAGISPYGVKVLLEIALGMNIVKVLPGDGEDRFVLGKTGWFLLEDEMTRVNFDFVNDVCYKGAFELKRSVEAGKPLGLEVFGHEGKTIYEVLSSLPEQVKKSWFAFDHFYSDIGFEEALPIVFSKKPKKIIDIGGNTAKWALCCCRYDPQVEVLIVDLPGQTAVAEREAAKAGFSDRIKTMSCNILNDETAIPAGADIVWMSQFLDCFSLEEVIHILKKVGAAAGPATDVFIFEPFWDKQRFEAASYSLQATSLYFTCMANGNSKMYNSGEFAQTVEKAGFYIAEAWHNVGSNEYSLLRCRISNSESKT